MKKVDLSILICSLESRVHYLENLLSILNPQKTESVEIIVNTDNGKKTIGQKRNELIEKSNGEYLCFIDDDDTVSVDYVSEILKKIYISKPDVVGFELNYFINGILNGIAYHSLDYKDWGQSFNDKTGIMNYYRNPNHLNPVKTNLAKQVMFPAINMKEDYDYSMRLLPLLKTQEYINKSIYNYLFIPNK